MRILMLSSTFPYPPSRGGTEIRTFNLLKYLQQNHDVTLVTQYNKNVSDTEVAELRKYVSELLIFPLPPEPQSKNAIAKLLGKTGRFLESVGKATPPNVLYRYSPEIQALVDSCVQAQKYDVITCEHSVNEIYIRPEFRHSVTTVVDVHSSVYGWIRDHLEMGAAQNAVRDRLYLSLVLKRYERRYCSKFSQIVVTTQDDRQEFLKLRPDIDIKVIPNGVDLELFPHRCQDPGGHNLIFVGAMDASHNIDAARFFAMEVLPQLQKRYPDATFSIVGARPTPEIENLNNIPGVIVTGRVASMVNYLHQSTVCVVPLRTGFGIKNKTLEAMAAGVPVVASDRGLEGLAVDGDNTALAALRANKPAEYVDAISQLFENPQLRSQLSQNGRKLVEAEFTWDIAGMRYEQVCLNR
ncbi:Glycosyl transferase, group 1 [Trichormus variabilis ATCC 29413]|uniref:Glycosyl transferase, group 1 n=2 Tax=Anabaena variabilis TaxID=264691 RepID=Q3M3Z0_TRIV2|nr:MULTISPECIES: glycosyltransferase family 4 protein [Nostocaceae]ABA24296.1 Glycosyl transferase, group 1 [Trichormus variabilis ATCC 29413]MBC1217346.1 glycosyltransferase [Trichormus variabilis ARAD]MBC1257543.1 glycosyltransferase [Trichormus variabilis V5]MBC1267121.1 glycosyltransferase [Trichormus variabilis FSR]MBC1301900.1 glycosyltransferase [Trichormus variabilis N2B]